MEIVKILELTGKGFNTDQIKQLNDYKMDDVSALLEAGKTTEEVMALLPIMDKNTPEVVPPVETPDEKKPEPNNTDALMQEIKQLKATIQADNLKKATINPDQVKTETADDVVKAFFDNKQK